MYLESFLNQKIQLKLRNLPDGMTGDVTGIYKEDDWILAKLVSAENIGLWVENPCYKTTPIRNEDGTAIPEQDQMEEQCTTNLLIRWDYISSLLTFPDERPVKLDKKTQLIGFQPDQD